MKVLNLYAGIGGNRKLWEDVEVTAIEWEPKIAEIYQDFFPDDKVIVSDAHQYLLEHYKEFDFIWSSPPCPSHGRPRFWGSKGGSHGVTPIFPDMKLYEEIVFLKHFFDGLYCVENVISYYDPLVEPQTVGRHYFWANFIIRGLRFRDAKNRGDTIGELENLKSFDLTKYKNKGINKQLSLALRNCVVPELGLAVLESARGNTQKTLTELIIVDELR